MRVLRSVDRRRLQPEHVDRAVALADLSRSPCATAREAASAAPRAACSSDSPRASSAASVAECVQPAPWVARTSSRSTGISKCRSPSKRWSTGSPWPPVTIAAGAPSSTSRSASSRFGPVADEQPRLDLVRRHHGCEGEEPRDQRCDGVLLQQPRARARDHHRVDHERHRMLGEEVRDRLDHRRREEHPRLGRVNADVVEDRLELGAHELRRQLVHGDHADRVLRGQRDDRARAEAAGGGEGLQVGLDPRASARVGARDRQTSRNQTALPSPVRTGSGSTGVISAREGTPVGPG